MANRLEVLLCALGCLLVFASPAIGYLLGGQLTWSDEDARQLQQASQEYHDALHQTDAADGRLDLAKQHCQAQQAALERT